MTICVLRYPGHQWECLRWLQMARTAYPRPYIWGLSCSPWCIFWDKNDQDASLISMHGTWAKNSHMAGGSLGIFPDAPFPHAELGLPLSMAVSEQSPLLFDSWLPPEQEFWERGNPLKGIKTETTVLKSHIITSISFLFIRSKSPNLVHT